jgi:peptidoglycan hydrolase-like protein with peptidoglycan-binding domain
METQKSSGRILKRGSRGPQVRELQKQLAHLGLNVEADGIFGENTERAVIQLQTMWGYDVDGIVGPGTEFLIEKRTKEGWNAQHPDAMEKALRAQGKLPEPAQQAAPAKAPSTPEKPAPRPSASVASQERAPQNNPARTSANAPRPRASTAGTSARGSTPSKKH